MPISKIVVLTFLSIISLDTRSHETNAWKSCYSHLKSLVGETRPIDHGNIESLHLAKSLDELDKKYGDYNFLWVQDYLTNESIRENNENVRRLLELPSPDRDQPKSNLVSAVSRKQARVLYHEMKTTPAVSNSDQYGDLGFCFFRALVVHAEALRRGVDPQSIRKIWAVGDMGEWAFHVSTIIKADDGGWYAIDDDFLGIKKVNDWMSKLTSDGKGLKDVMFFVTQADRSAAYSRKTYNSFDFFNVPEDALDSFVRENDYYKGIYHDYFKWLGEQETPVQFLDLNKLSTSSIDPTLVEFNKYIFEYNDIIKTYVRYFKLSSRDAFQVAMTAQQNLAIAKDNGIDAETFLLEVKFLFPITKEQTKNPPNINEIIKAIESYAQTTGTVQN